MFQRTLLLRYLRLVRKYLAIIGVGGGVMLMSKVSVPLRYTLTYTRCSTPVVTLETGAPEHREVVSLFCLRMGARTSLRSSCRALSALMGASLVFNPAFSGRSSPLASPP